MHEERQLKLSLKAVATLYFVLISIPLSKVIKSAVRDSISPIEMHFPGKVPSLLEPIGLTLFAMAKDCF